jgi:ribosome-associated toxin RatA of RatAB toxin-antitoxin module
MRIFKYTLLLLLLVIIGLVVFISTQNSDYSITKSKIVKCSPSNAFNYVSDLKNWEDFVSWNESNNANFTNLSAKNASWKGENPGKVETLFLKNNDSIAQKISYNEVESELHWNFKKVKNGTEIIVTNKGKMDLMQKLNAFFNGTTSTTLANAFEKSLINLDKNLDYEVNTFAIKQNGIVNFPKTFFIGKTINSSPEKINKNVGILIKEMIDFFNKNDIKINGKPFVIYNAKIDTRVNLSVCMPMKDSVHISPMSDVFASKIEATNAVKTTLTGDYSHLQTAKDSAFAYLNKNKLKQSVIAKPFQVYTNTKLNTKKPSQWITEYYIPIYTKPEPKPVVIKPVAIQEEAVTTP